MRLAREVLVDELTPLLPPERQLDARLAAAAIAIALREAAAGDEPALAVAAELARLYGLEAPQDPGRGEEMLRRFAGDLRAGALAGPRERGVRKVLWRLTLAKLREGNPKFLAANGFEV